MKHKTFSLLIIFAVLLMVSPMIVFAGRASQTDKPADPSPTPELTETSENKLRQSDLMNWSAVISEENLPESQPLPQRSEEGIEIRLQQAVFDPLVSSPELPPTLTTTAVTPNLPDSDYYLVQFIGPIQAEWRVEVEELGGEVIDYVPDFAYIVKMDGATAVQVQELDVVRWVGLYQPAFRLSNQLLSSLSTAQADTSTELIVRSFIDEPAAKLSTQLEALGAVIQESGEESGGGVIFKVVVPETAVADIAHIKGVAWVEDYSQPHLVNEVARSSTAMNKDQVETVLGLYGEDQIVVVGDTGVSTGDPATVHLDLRGRVFGGTTGAGSTCGGWQDGHSHGTHVAGSVLGNGYHSGSIAATHSYAGTNAGIAPEALLYAWGFCNDFSGLPDTDPYNDYFSYMYNLDSRVRVNTNSWGSTAPAGTYDTFSRETDRFIRDNPDMVVLFAASNDGTDSNSDGVIDLDSMGIPAGSKNIITVGASENERTGNAFTWGSSWPTDYPVSPIFDDLVADNANGMAAFSSRGPVDDGRLKPDIIAPGSNIVSTRYEGSGTGWGIYDDHYLYMGGTSMATPLAAGASAIVREFYTDTYSINPGAALVKATLINGAYDMTPGQYGAGATQDVVRRPDNNQGWGRVDLANSLVYEGHRSLWFNEHIGLNTGGIYQTTFNVLDDSVPFKATLVWVDYPGLEATHGALVNDLDLEVEAPDGTVYYGNDIIDGILDDDIDHINNVEGIDLSAQVGTYTVTVRGFNVPQGSQPFALVVTAGTSPVGYLNGVVDDGVTPIVGATVTAVGVVTSLDDTDAGGSYQMTLPVGNYDVTASAYGYSPVTVNGVTIISGTATIQDFTLSALQTHTVSGVVTDAATGWPLYAQIDIPSYPGSPIWTDPETGYYSVGLLAGNTYDFTVSAWVDGYTDATRSIGPLSTDIIEDFSLAADVMSCSAPGYTLSVTPLLSESFETWPLPTGWNIVDNDGGGCVWQAGSTDNDANMTGGTGDFADADSDYCGFGSSMDTDLQTPILDLTGQPDPVLEFKSDMYFWSTDVWDVDMSLDGGTTWPVNLLHREGSSYRGPETITLPMTGAGGNNNVRVRFRYQGDWDYWWQIDDVVVESVSCTLNSGGLVVGNVYDGNTSVALNGATVSNEDGYSTTSVATPDDPNVDDGFYTLFSPAGSKLFTASATNYTDDIDTVAVAVNDTVRHDFSLGRGLLSYTPAALEATIPAGTSTIRPFTITNSGSAAANFQLLEISGSASDVLLDGGFEGGTPNSDWNEASTNYGTPICDLGSCGADVARSGTFWLWLGGANSTEIGSVDQDVVIPTGTATLAFWLLLGDAGAVASMDVSVDGDVLFSVTEADAASYPTYTEVTIDVSAYADGSSHNVRFESTEYGTVDDNFNFHVDDVSLIVDPGIPWLSEAPVSGTIAATTDQPIDVTFDATGLASGQYTGQLVVAHDTPSVLQNVPVTLTVFTGYLWNGSINTDWSNASNWTPNGVPSTLDSVVVDPVNLIGASVWPVLNVSSTIADLTLESGAELTIPNGRSLAVNGTLTNNGLLRQTIDNVNSATTFLGMGGYGGVEITPSGDMGSTKVEIRGNQDCTTDPTSQPVRRCFDITPTTAQFATIRFYYLPSEANGNPENGVLVYHWNSISWDPESGTTTHSNGDDPRWVQVEGVSSYSPFVLDNTEPTAVSLAQFTSENSGTATAVLLIISFVTLMLLSVMIVARRKR